MNRTHLGQIGRKDGIAIVLVLGLLSLLLLLAVAFSVSMRIERSGAGNYAYSVYAKHLAWTALARAMKSVDADLDAGAQSSMYPEWDMLASGAGAISWVNLGGAKALEYIPGSMTNMVAITNAGWEDVEDTNNSVVGRSAYLVVNTSGFLDVNLAGGTNRMLGTSAAELQLEWLPDFGTVAKTNAFVIDRRADGRYENLSEFRYLNSGLTSNRTASFVTYSMSPEQKYMGATGLVQKACVGGTETNLQNAAVKANILQKLADSGVSDAAARLAAYNSLVDYVDGDCIPVDLGSPSTELVPMINEAILDYEVEVLASGDYRVRGVTLNVEWFYPFDVATTNTFVADFGVTKVTDLGSTYPQLMPSTFSASAVPAGLGASVHQHITRNTGAPDKSGSGLDPSSAMTVHFIAEVKAQIKQQGGAVVDSVPFPYGNDGIPIEFNFVIPAVAAGSRTITTQEWAECVDPRFNWDPSNAGWEQWAISQNLRGLLGDPQWSGLTVESSPDAFNNYAAHLLSHDVGATIYGVNFDGTNELSATHLYVANRPLQTVGEMGYLCIRPWSTLRLYDHHFAHPMAGDPAYHKVLDCFTVYPPQVPGVRGQVNVNSFNTNVLAAVFYRAREKEFVPTSTNLSWATATTIAKAIVQGGPYTNLSAIGAVGNWPSYVNGQSDIEREAPIRNSAGLLTVRQNLFTILLASGTTSRGIGEIGRRSMGDWLSYQKAVALVWRDPFPVVTTETPQPSRKNHYWFVRYFSILED